MARDWSGEEGPHTTLTLTLATDFRGEEGERRVDVTQSWRHASVTWPDILRVCLDVLRAAGYNPPDLEELVDGPALPSDTPDEYE